MYQHGYLGFHPQQIFFRVDGGFTLPKTTTALDVVMFERNEYQNVEEMDMALDIVRKHNIDLSKYNWRDIVWVTKVREAALRYADSQNEDLKDVEFEDDDEDEVEEVHITNALILADDGDNGFLVLDVKEQDLTPEVKTFYKVQRPKLK